MEEDNYEDYEVGEVVEKDGYSWIKVGPGQMAMIFEEDDGDD